MVPSWLCIILFLQLLRTSKSCHICLQAALLSRKLADLMKDAGRTRCLAVGSPPGSATPLAELRVQEVEG